MNFNPLKPKIKTMSTIPKEDELKIYFENNFDIYGDSQGDVVQAFTFSEFKKAIKHFADGREELENQITQLKGMAIIKDARIDYDKEKITTLQSSLIEKEKKCEELKVCFENSCNDVKSSYKLIEELKAENERLSGLLVSLSNGQPMNVVRESEGTYSVIFKPTA